MTVVMHLKKLFKKQILAIALMAFVAFWIVLLNSDLSPDFYYLHWLPLENITCYNVEGEDVLPSADGRTFLSSSIFFHETSCKGGLDYRQACAVESAARAHPDWQINVLFTAPGTKEALKRSSALLKELENVKYYRIHLVNYSKDTPLEDLIAKGALNRTRWRISHASDVLRYLTLFKWGGVYLDLDVVVVKSLTSLVNNWAARESNYCVAAGAMAFSMDKVGRSIADAAIRDIKRSYRGDIWGHNGPGVITRVLKQMCSTSEPSEMSAVLCKGFEVYGPEVFYPIEWQRGQEYFEPGPFTVTADARVYHVWNHITHKYRTARGSPYEKLVKKFCPLVYKVFNEDFF